MSTASVPTLELEGPTGRRVVVAPRSGDDRVGDLAAALGVAPGCPLVVDGRRVGRHETLAGAGIVRGSRVAVDDDRPAPAPTPPLVTVVCEAGPDAGRTVRLGPGRHVIGRAPRAAVHLDDPDVEPHHAVLDVGVPEVGGDVAALDGGTTRVGLRQLTGRVPCRLDGRPVAAARVPDGAVVSLGASRLRIRHVVDAPVAPAVLAAHASDPWRRTLRRTPRRLLRWEPEPVRLPGGDAAAEQRTPASGLVAAGCAAVGAVVVALVLGSPLFVLVAGIGVAASVAMWLAGRLGAARDRRRRRARRTEELGALRRALAAQRAAWWRHHAATTAGVAEAVAAATTWRGDLWSRRSGHADLVRAALGWGAVTWEPVLDGPAGSTGDEAVDAEIAGLVAAAGHADDAPVGVDLEPGAAIALAGPGADGVARSLVVQLVTWAGPADLQLVVLTGSPAAWDWCRWLPHTAGPSGPRVADAADPEQVAAALLGLDDGTGRHVLVVTDRPDLLGERTGVLRRHLATASSTALVAIVPPGAAPPAVCRSLLEVGSLGRARWSPDIAAGAPATRLHAAAVTIATATEVARRLAALDDPEDPSGTGALPRSVALGELLERHGPGPVGDPIAIAAAWRAGGVDPPPRATLGATADGVVEVDLARDGPHVLVAGTTGAGKSELLRTLVVTLAARCSPDHVTFVLVDYKGGSTFDACAALPHTVGIVTDLDDRLAERALTSLDAEVRRREHLLRTTGATDLAEHRRRTDEPLPRLVVVVDEFAALAVELPDFLGALVGIAQRGRSLGVHLVLATQRPGGVVSDDIRNNTNLRVALRLQDATDARDVVGDDAPAGFPRGTPGRAMLRLGADERVVFQTACSAAPPPRQVTDRLHVVADAPDDAGSDESELTLLVRSVRNAAALSDVAPPFRPWLPPLPSVLTEDELNTVADATAVGIVDEPAGQCRRPLRWCPEDGNLAILGGVGTGTTTALRSVLLTLCTARPPAACHLHVIDGRGSADLDPLAALDHCAGVVRLHERERLSRLLRRAVDELDARRAGPGHDTRSAFVLAIDGYPALRSLLDDPLDRVDHDRLVRVVTEGTAVGVVTILTAERPSALPAAVLATCARRWVGRLEDPAEEVLAGVGGLVGPDAPPGRFALAGDRLVAQVADLGTRADLARRGPGGPAPIGTLPAHVRRTCHTGGTAAAGATTLVVGTDFDTLGAATLHVPDGEHVLVAGPARSGRSTALATLATAWTRAAPDGTVLVVAPRDPAAFGLGAVVHLDVALRHVDGAGPHEPVLLVVDDAEGVDDPRLGALAEARRPGVLIAAAGRPDALRARYGHWTTVIRRSRTGVLLAACADLDGDLVGELLPRHPPIPARPGLAWLVDHAGRRLAQLAA
jgi:S-DNA-T family DNA segregation ATPase FtsK/SpoIIIE